MKKISSRQLIIFYFIYTFSIKFLMLPSLLATEAGRDCWLAAAFGTIIELVVLFFTLTALKLNRDEDLYASLRNKNAFSFARNKVIFTVMLAMFLLQIFILLNQTYYLLNDNMFENMSADYFIIPMLVFGAFFCFMPSRAIFRSGEIFFIFIIIALVFSVFPSIANINPSEVLPLFNNGMGFAKSTYTNLIYFESASMLLIFSGEIKIERNFIKKFMLVAAILGAAFVSFVFVFYSLHGPLAPIKNIAISDISLYGSGGKFDWILITLWLLMLLLRFGITFFCAFTCIKYIIHIKNRAGIISTVMAIVIYLAATFVFTTSRTLNNFITSIPWLIAILYVMVPVFFLLNGIIKHVRRKHENAKTSLA